MPGTRSIAKDGDAKAKPEKPHKVFKRGGSITDVERNLVTQFVQDQPREMTTSQVNSLAKVMRRSRETVKALVEDAREKFVAAAGMYVDLHREATIAAYETGDNEVAIKGSQWYLEHVAAEGVRVIDKAVAGPQGTKIFIGIKMGGVAGEETVTTIPAITVPIDG